MRDYRTDVLEIAEGISQRRYGRDFDDLTDDDLQQEVYLEALKRCTDERCNWADHFGRKIQRAQ